MAHCRIPAALKEELLTYSKYDDILAYYMKTHASEDSKFGLCKLLWDMHTCLADVLRAEGVLHATNIHVLCNVVCLNYFRASESFLQKRTKQIWRAMPHEIRKIFDKKYTSLN